MIYMQNLREFFYASTSINIVDVIINVILAGLMSQLIYFVFVRYGNTFSNRRQFGKIFFLVTVCTTLIISVIQASLALSLGLVGALSIVRFRSAIKEPEELAYLFFCITMGLGFGANARGLSLLNGFVISAIIIIRGLLGNKKNKHDTFNFSIVSSALNLDEILKAVQIHASSATLKRADNEGKVSNAQLIVEFKSVDQLQNTIEELKKSDPDVSTSFISNSTLI